MTLAQLLNLPVTLIVRSHDDTADVIDEFGGELRDETLVETVGELQQQQRTENASADETSETSWLLILPPSTTLHTGDGVIANGHVFEVNGEPWSARNPRTRQQSHVEVTLKRISAAGDEAGS